MILPDALRATPATVAAPRPKLEEAELMPEVEMIQVEILGTVNIQMAPIKNTMITVPNESTPLPANTAILAIVALASSARNNSWYLEISELRAYFCIKAHRYITK